MLTIEEISDKLCTLPGEIARQDEIVENFKYTWEKAKVTQEVLEIKRAMELKVAKLGEKKLSDITIEGKIKEEFLTERIAILGMESNFRKEKGRLNKLEKEFEAMKALAYLKQREIKGGIDY